MNFTSLPIVENTKALEHLPQEHVQDRSTEQIFNFPVRPSKEDIAKVRELSPQEHFQERIAEQVLTFHVFPIIENTKVRQHLLREHVQEGSAEQFLNLPVASKFERMCRGGEFDAT